MSESPNIEELKRQLDELREFVEMSDEDMKLKLIEDIEEQFSNPEAADSLRTSYREAVGKLEGMLTFLEGMTKVAEGLNAADSASVIKIVKSEDIE